MSNQRTMESVLRRAEIESLESESLCVSASASENLQAFTATQALVAARFSVQDPPLPAKARSQVAQFKVDSATWHPIRRTILNVGPRR